jgi:CheY-like chemotaxis protein
MRWMRSQKRNAGQESVSVTGGAEVLAMLHVCKPSLLILDVNMPTTFSPHSRATSARGVPAKIIRFAASIRNHDAA